MGSAAVRDGARIVAAGRASPRIGAGASAARQQRHPQAAAFLACVRGGEEQVVAAEVGGSLSRETVRRTPKNGLLPWRKSMWRILIDGERIYLPLTEQGLGVVAETVERMTPNCAFFNAL